MVAHRGFPGEIDRAVPGLLPLNTLYHYTEQQLGTDLLVTDPLLGLLQNNGGSTWTRALPANRQAIDAGTNSGCPATDQRGNMRPIDGNGDGTAKCDIGAFEYGVLHKIYLPAMLKNYTSGW